MERKYKLADFRRPAMEHKGCSKLAALHVLVCLLRGTQSDHTLQQTLLIYLPIISNYC